MERYFDIPLVDQDKGKHIWEHRKESKQNRQPVMVNNSNNGIEYTDKENNNGSIVKHTKLIPQLKRRVAGYTDAGYG